MARSVGAGRTVISAGRDAKAMEAGEERYTSRIDRMRYATASEQASPLRMSYRASHGRQASGLILTFASRQHHRVQANVKIIKSTRNIILLVVLMILTFAPDLADMG